MKGILIIAIALLSLSGSVFAQTKRDQKILRFSGLFGGISRTVPVKSFTRFEAEQINADVLAIWQITNSRFSVQVQIIQPLGSDPFRRTLVRTGIAYRFK